MRLVKPTRYFFDNTELTEESVMPLVSDALAGGDDGELFLEEKPQRIPSL